MYRQIRQAVLANRRQIKIANNAEYFITLSQHPDKFTQDELDRLVTCERNRLRRGRRAPIPQSNYTDIKRGNVFRRPLFGRGGPALNGAWATRALQPRPNVSHSQFKAKGINYAFKLHAHGKKSTYFRSPLLTPRENLLTVSAHAAEEAAEPTKPADSGREQSAGTAPAGDQVCPIGKPIRRKRTLASRRGGPLLNSANTVQIAAAPSRTTMLNRKEPPPPHTHRTS